MASFGSLAISTVGHLKQGEVLKAKAANLAQQQASLSAGTAPKNVTAASLATKNRNLSNAQFRHKIEVAHTASEAAQSVTESNGPNIGDPSWSPPSAIGPGLYS